VSRFTHIGFALAIFSALFAMFCLAVVAWEAL